VGFDLGTFVNAHALTTSLITNAPRVPLGIFSRGHYLKGEIHPDPWGYAQTIRTCRYKFRDRTVIIACCRGHGNRDKILLGLGNARVGSERGDNHF
jgi:hypothetical protein